MKFLRSRLILFLSVIPACIAPAVANSPAEKLSPCSEIPQTNIDSGTFTADDMEQLSCWYENGSPSAGIQLARAYRAATPPQFEKARAILKDLANGEPAPTVTYRNVPMGGGQTGIMASNSHGGSDRLPRRAPLPAAQRELAKMMIMGEGDSPNLPGADRWLKKAIKGGDVEAKTLRDVLVQKGVFKK